MNSLPVSASGDGADRRPQLISVIVTTFDREDALAVVLDALRLQTDQAFEIVVADDGSGPATRALLDAQREFFPGRLKHVWQPHRGFRAAEMRNRGVLECSGDYLVFLDGDCVPRPTFIARHRALAERNYFVAGNRVLLSPDLTGDILSKQLQPSDWPFTKWISLRAQQRINRLLPLLHLWLGSLRRLRSRRWRDARSCNFALWRDQFGNVDGFDAAFTGWGREDSDLILRLLHSGVRRKDGMFATGVFHLWHPPSDQSRLTTNDAMLEDVIAQRSTRAKEGLSALSAPGRSEKHSDPDQGAAQDSASRQAS